MMRKLYYVLLAVALVASSCQKDLGNGAVPEKPGAVPESFDWKTTREVSAAVAAPVVDGEAPLYAVVGIYASPILTDANRVAMGVAKASAPFHTAFALPVGVKDVYVQTTLPDGTKSVKMVAVQPMINVAGASMKSAVAPRIRLAAETLRESSMPDFTKMETKSEADFDPQAVIRSIGNGSYQLGASWAFYAAPEYYIPAGAEIQGAIDLNGGFSPYQTPVLYVAGKLSMQNLGIGQGRLVVLPGGEVTLAGLSTNGAGSADRPSVYVFEGGKITVEGKPNIGSKYIVNCGEFVVNNDLDFNNSAVVYNAATGVMKAEEMKCSNEVKIFSDGVIGLDNLKLNSNAEFYNCENARLGVGDLCEFERNTTIYQRGHAEFDEIIARGTMWVNCYTRADEVSGEGADFNLGAGVAFEAEEVEFNNTNVSLAGGAQFVTEEYNVGKKGGKTYFTAAAGADPLGVVVIKEKAYTKKGHETYFSGPMEVVYDNEKDSEYTIDRSYLNDGAVMRAEQSVVISGSYCNGGKVPVDPDPEPEPDEYVDVPGASYTYCFEDNWPWFGDYDMNDVVVVCSIDRRQSKDGSKVASVKINWELKAAGTTYDIAFAVQMDKVRTSEVISAESGYTGFKSGMFSSAGLEAGNEYAVIPFFNDTKDLLSASNTWKGHPAVPTTKYTTTVTFAEPVDAAAVVEPAMNFFITVNTRSNEIHMPGYPMTASGVLAKGCILPNDPYRFFVPSGEHLSDNYMMWALAVPGDFRYPAEGKDIRSVYDYFTTWASSGGTQHEFWYEEEANEQLLFK